MVRRTEQQGRFREYLDVLLERQDSLGLKPWTSYGAEAGVPDVDALLAGKSAF